LCEQLVAAAQYLQAAGMSTKQLSRLHHDSLKGRKVYFATAYDYFGQNRELDYKNINYAERLKFVAAKHKQGGEGLETLIEQALNQWPRQGS
jgi:hypothetical protein